MSDSESNAEDVFDVDRIRRLVELMEQHDISEVNLRQSGQKIRLRRGQPAAAVLPPTAYPAPLAPPVAMTAPQAAPESVATPSDPPENPDIVVISSPMVGTFYARANPNADPFVRIGDQIDVDTTVCIIEAMKVFNEIPGEVRGKVVAILVDDEEPVDHGRPLFKVDTSAG